MKKARIWLLLAGLLAALTLVVAGCGSDDDEAGDTGASRRPRRSRRSSTRSRCS